MSKILTVTVPAYNVEKFIQRTLDSFLAQEVIDDIEVIVVDDGSKDSTAQIAQKYYERYPQTFIVVSKENGGHGSAINKGLELANGQYFKVVDGDDWVDTQAFIKLVQYLKTSQTDVVLNHSCHVNNDTGAQKPINIAKNLEYNRQYTFAEIFKEIQLGLAWMSIKTKILKENQNSLDEHCFYVDMEFILFPVPFITTVVYLDMYLYMYRIAMSTQSTSMEAMQKNLPDHDKVLFRLVDFLNEYKNSPTSENGKVDYIAWRISKMYAAHIRIYLSFPLKLFPIRKTLLEVEEKMKRCCEVVYNNAGNNRDVKILRKTNYHSFKILHFCVNLYKMRRT